MKRNRNNLERHSVSNKTNSCKYNNINKIIITAVTKNTSSNRSVFSKRQFNTDTYHTRTCIATENTSGS